MTQPSTDAELVVFGGKPVRAQSYPPWPEFDERDEEAVLRVVRSRRWGGWPYPGRETELFLEEFASAQGGHHAVACANGTVTMEIALRAAGIGWGDEVIVPAYTFQASAVAPLAAGARPVLVDVDPSTYCIAPQRILDAIGENTKAVIAVHVGHQLADMDAILEIARRHSLLVIEDAAHAHGAKWGGHGAGTLGDFGSFSLQSNKLVSTGEGGVLLCRSPEMARRAASIADNGRSHRQPGHGEEAEASLLGTNFRMTELQAALGRVALQRLPEQTRRRAEAADHLDELLRAVPGVRVLPRDPRHSQRSFFGYVFAIDQSVFGFDNRVVCHLLNSEGIPCWKGYESLHKSRLFCPKRSALPLARAAPMCLEFAHLPLANAEIAATEAVWLRENVMRDGRTGVELVANALEKILLNRDRVVPRQERFTSEWKSAEELPRVANSPAT